MIASPVRISWERTLSNDLVTIDVVDGVADVRLNRPDKYNALSPDMFKAIVAAGEQLSEAKDVRAVVLSGNGRGFCAGLDMQSMAGLADGASGGGSTLFDREERPENFAQRPAMVWKRMPVPVIAALHGVAYGGGAQIALGADMRNRAARARNLKARMVRDSLTGLYNHTHTLYLLEQEIVRARQKDQPLAFAMIDIDEFKSLNDTGGHSTGDKALDEIAKRLTGTLRNVDTVARIGGDEFTIILLCKYIII